MAVIIQIVRYSTVMLLLASCADSGGLAVERIDEQSGFYTVCGQGVGLSPCRDGNGETFSQELNDTRDLTNEEANAALEAQAAEIRSESPEELEKTIEALEHRR